MTLPTLQPGRAEPLGALRARRRRQLRRVLRPRRRASSCACSTPSGARELRALRAARPAATASSTASCRASARAWSTACARTAPTQPERGPPLQPAQAAARPLGARDRRPLRAGAPSTTATSSATPTGTRSLDTRDNALQRAEGARRPPPPAAPRPAQRAAPSRRATSCSTRCTSRASRMQLPGLPEALRGTYAGAGAPGGDRALQGAGRHHAVAAAGALPPRRAAPGRAAACVNYWGYNTLGFFCPDPRYAAATAATRRRWRRVPRDGARRCTRTASRWCSTSSTTTRPRAASTARRCRLRGLDNATWYRLHARRPQPLREPRPAAATRSTSRTRASRSSCSTRCATGCSEMGVDGFRFDLAPVLGRTRQRLRRQRAVLHRAARRTRCWRART